MAKKEKAKYKPIKEDQPDPAPAVVANPPFVDLEATTNTFQGQPPTALPAIYLNKDATSAPPPPIAATETVQGQNPHLLSSTLPGVAAGILTGNLKPRVLMILLLALLACLIFALWMAKIDNDWGRLVWPNGYIDFGRKVLLIVTLFTAFVALGLTGLLLFQLFRLLRSLWSSLISWWQNRS